MLNRLEEEMPSTSDIAKVDDIKLQEIMKNVVRSTENLTAQLEGESSEDLGIFEEWSLEKGQIPGLCFAHLDCSFLKLHKLPLHTS